MKGAGDDSGAGSYKEVADKVSAEVKVTNTYALLPNDIWTSPKDLCSDFCELLSPVKKFHDGKHLYPTDFTGINDPRDIFRIKKIDKNFLINPPFSVIEQHLTHWEKIAKDSGKYVAVICPTYPDAQWYKDFSRKYFYLKYTKNIQYLYGPKKIIRGLSRFHTSIIILNFQSPKLKHLVLTNKKNGKIRRLSYKQKIIKKAFSTKNIESINDHECHTQASQIISDHLIKLATNNEKWQQKKMDIFEKYPNDLLTTLSDTGKHALMKLEDKKSDVDKLLTLNNFDVTSKTFIDKSMEHKVTKLNKKNRAIPIAEEKLLTDTYGKGMSKQQRKKIHFKDESNKSNTCHRCQTTGHSNQTCSFKHDPISVHPSEPYKKKLVEFITLKFEELQVPEFYPALQTRREYINSEKNRIEIERNLFWHRFKLYSGLEKQQINEFEFSKLADSVGYHAAIGTDKETLRRLICGIQIKWSKIPQNVDIVRPSQDRGLAATIVKYLEQNIIYAAPAEYFSNISPIFPKPEVKKIRPIFDMSYLNSFLPNYKTKLPKIQIVMNNMQKNDRFITLDYTNAYSQLKIHPNSYKFLGFRYDGITYGYKTLPFGFKPAVWYFTKMTRYINRYIKNIFPAWTFIDDILIKVGNSEKDTKSDLEMYETFLIELMGKLGVQLNEKGVTKNTTSVEWIGWSINSEGMKIKPTEKRLNSLLEQIARIESEEKISLKSIEKLIGKLQSLQLVLPFAGIFTKFLKNILSENADLNNNHKITMNRHFKEEIASWGIFFHSLERDLNKIDDKNSLYLVADTGESFTGAFLMYKKNIFNLQRFKLPHHLADEDSTAREAIGLSLTIEKSPNAILELKNQENINKLTFVCDNRSTLLQIIKKGSPNNEAQEQIKKIWQFCYQNQLSIDIQWSRRTTIPIKLADDIGRIDENDYIFDESFIQQLILKKWATNKIPFKYFDFYKISIFNPEIYTWNLENATFIVPPNIEKLEIITQIIEQLNIKNAFILTMKCPTDCSSTFKFTKNIHLNGEFRYNNIFKNQKKKKQFQNFTGLAFQSRRT